MLITNARIVDGSGQPAISGAVRIEGDTIIELGALEPRAGETVVDARGQVLAPGFIDTHSHHDEGLADNLAVLPLLTQGITTAVFGQDGGHPLPLGDFFEAYERRPASVNVASYIGHNSLREQVMGDADNLDEIQFVLNELTPASGIIFTRFEPEPGYVNQSVAEIAELRGTREVQTFSDLLKEAAAWSAANGGKSAESIMGRSMTENDIATFLAWPHANVCTDGGFSGHPRGYGAFPRVLARYVRDRNVMTLEAAIEAMTSRAATHLGIVDRGLIAPRTTKLRSGARASFAPVFQGLGVVLVDTQPIVAGEYRVGISPFVAAKRILNLIVWNPEVEHDVRRIIGYRCGLLLRWYAGGFAVDVGAGQRLE